MANIPAPTALNAAGVALTTLPTAGLASMSFVNDGRTVLAIRNGGGAGITATFISQKQISDGAPTPLDVNDRAVAVAASGIVLVGPFPRDVYNDANGECQLTLSAVTSVTVQALQMLEAR